MKMIGLILKGIGGFYSVETEEGRITCKARGRFRKERITPLAGDQVEITAAEDGTGTIDEILPRKNHLVRPPVANLDRLFVVSSMCDPSPDKFLIDKTIAAAETKQIEPVLVFTKTDLQVSDGLENIYRNAGFLCCVVSSATGEGVEKVSQLLEGKISAFTGNSGVGKSSILNALDPAFQLQVGDVSQALGRGRHTTRHVELFHLSCGADVVDSPGFSSFETDELNLELKHRLPETFVEFRPYLDQCRFVGCSHTKEKGCAVLEAVRAGKIQRSRHASYVRLYEELKPLQDWQERKK